MYLGLLKYKSIPQLVEEKRVLQLTDEEKKVKEIPSVKKGFDLEPLILDKFSKQMNRTVVKPPHMYQHPEQKQLTVNFDGVILETNRLNQFSGAFEDGVEHLIPVEAKYIVTTGDKYYGKNPDFMRAAAISIPERSPNVIEHCNKIAGEIGIPPYYYSQVQQQIYFLDAPYGYLVALSEKDWELRIYLVKRDEYLINQILIESARLQSRIESLRGC